MGFSLNPELWSKINFVEKRIKPATVATEINGKIRKTLFVIRCGCGKATYICNEHGHSITDGFTRKNLRDRLPIFLRGGYP